MPINIASLLNSLKNKQVYVFTTQGHVISGTLEDVEEYVELVAPDGVTRVQVILTDISGVRLNAEEAEDVS